MTLIYSNPARLPVRAESNTDEPSERGIPAHYTPAPDTPAPEIPGPPVVTPVLTPSQERAQRRSLKALAAAVDADSRALARIGWLGGGINEFPKISERLRDREAQLAALRSAGLTSRAPAAPSTARTVKNSLLRNAARTTRVAAMATTAAAAVAEVAVTVPVAVLAGAGYGAWQGAESSWNGPTHFCLKPGAALVCGAVASATFATFAVMLAPVTILRAGSVTRQSYAWVDRYPRTQAHIARKQMSNLQLADNISDLITGVHSDVSRRVSRAYSHAQLGSLATCLFPA